MNESKGLIGETSRISVWFDDEYKVHVELTGNGSTVALDMTRETAREMAKLLAEAADDALEAYESRWR